MALVLKKLYEGYFHLCTIRDPRTEGNFGLGNPLYVVSIMALYVYLVKRALPKYMEKRPPYNLKNIIIIYNILQILGNLYVGIKLTMIVGEYNFFCSPVTYNSTPTELEHIKALTVYYYLKIFDLVDTIFFVLRKSFRQVSFLHVFHHAAMVLTVWVPMSYFPTGHSIWCALINSWVHVIMFSYYLLTALDDKWKESISLKKFITQIQMVQFLAIFISYGAAATNLNCDYPKISMLLPINDVFMLILFLDFYRKSYWQKQKSN